MQLEPGENICEVHVESKAFFFCIKPECKKFICIQCATSVHKDHPIYVTKFVNDTAKENLMEEFKKATSKVDKNLATTEKMLSGKGPLKTELEEIVFHSKYTTLLRQKVKEYEKHNAELIEANKKLNELSDKNHLDSMDTQKKFYREIKLKNEELAELQKKYTEDTNRLNEEIQTRTEENDKKIMDLNDEHKNELEKLNKEKVDLESQLKILNDYKTDKAKKEAELRKCEETMDAMERKFQEERIALTNLHMKNIDEMKVKQEADEFLEKNRARLMAQKDLAITEETHKR